MEARLSPSFQAAAPRVSDPRETCGYSLCNRRVGDIRTNGVLVGLLDGSYVHMHQSCFSRFMDAL